MKLTRLLFFITGLSLVAACGSYPPMKTVAHVELEKFMGDWYVIANIPTFIEQGAHNAVESYRLNKDGSIDTTFTFHDGSFTGKKKTYRPTGYVVDKKTNATWGMQFIWPVKADYRVIYLDDDYTQTIIARQQRDYAWIMARQPVISDRDYQSHLKLLQQHGYDITQVERVPQQWPVTGRDKQAR